MTENEINFPAEIALPHTGEILAFSYVDFEFNQGFVGIYVGHENSKTTVAFTMDLAQHFAESL